MYMSAQYICVCVCVRVLACMCVHCEYRRLCIYGNPRWTCISVLIRRTGKIYIYINRLYIYMYMCVCVDMHVRAVFPVRVCLWRLCI